jgi:hypothetical protein
MAEEHGQQANPNQDLIAALEHELQSINPEYTPTIYSCIENELFKLRGGVTDTIDLFSGRWIKVRAKVHLSNDLPKMNPVGRLLGPRGENLKNLQTTTKTKMGILGKGSMRDPKKEEDFLASGDPKYQHLKQNLHLQIDSFGDPADTYYRLSHAIAEVQKCIHEQSQNPVNVTGGFGQPTPMSEPLSTSPVMRGGPQMRGRGAGQSPAMMAPPPGSDVSGGDGFGVYGGFQNGGGKMPMRGGQSRGRGDATRPYSRGRGGRP